jgi:uncharacterized protein (TIGR02145 family)
MKKVKIFLIIGLITLLNSNFTMGQIGKKIGNNPFLKDRSAVLELESTSKGFLPPRLTIEKKNSISNPATGLLVYCTDNISYGELQYYDGTKWVNMMGFVSPVLDVISITSSSATALTVQSSVTNEGTYSVTSRGFVIALDSINPPDTSNKLIESSKLAGTGTFSSTITNLVSGTTLNIRAYASVNTGTLTYTAYSSIMKFPVPGVNATITSPTGKVWMDRNLGANNTPTAFDDYQNYGNLYQWGRGSDGHQVVSFNDKTIANPNSNTTSTKYTSGSSTRFIIGGTGTFIFDWRVSSNNFLWDGVNSINNPCPNGFRLPTNTEANAEANLIMANSNTNKRIAAFALLKLTASGYRYVEVGQFIETGVTGRYWTSTTGGTYVPGNGIPGQGPGVYHFFISSSSAGTSNQTTRASGFSVRCIQD